MDNIWILAQAEGDQSGFDVPAGPITDGGETGTTTSTAADPNATAPPREQRPAFSPQQFIFIGLMIVVMYLLLFRGPRKKQQQHKQMVQSLEKNDRIRTIGGIIGVVVDIKDDEITLKVDESNNTKIKIAASAVGRNLSKDKN
ncbi:MAG: preprotein translocase subunit YajC [Planctomycetota bacterium]|jgi:preprotein translocase subunit YajC